MFNRSKREEISQKFEELLKRHKERHHLHDEFHKRHDDLHRYFKYSRYSRPAALLFNLLILYLLFSWIGIKAIGFLFALLIIIKEIVQFIFLRRLEKGILKPLGKLKNGVEEIAKGNYNVEVESNVNNEISLLMNSFNQMAQKLRESEKLKNEYEENRRMLIANITHDLKTPITSIQGYIEAMLDGNTMPEENANRYLQIIHRNSVYINKLIDDLFLFSKLDMQKLDFNFENIPVRAFMNDLTEEFKLELEEKGIRFKYIDRVESTPWVNIDRKRIHQALRNIIGNAVKYGPEQGLSIEVQMYEQDGFLYIEIKDNGPGIPEDKLNHIFERFYRIDIERTKDFTGTGLGLAIAKELVEAHGGSIKASSNENEGTCFTIRLAALKSHSEGACG